MAGTWMCVAKGLFDFLMFDLRFKRALILQLDGSRLAFIDPRLGKLTGISIKLLTCPLIKRASSKGLQSHARAWL